MPELKLVKGRSEEIRIRGTKYVSLAMAAQSLDLAINTVRNSRDPKLMAIRIRHRGRVFFDEQGLQRYLESDVEYCV